MVAKNIRFMVVEIPINPNSTESRIRARARDLLPEADPYIAGLIRKLQAEVRAERAAQCRLDKTAVPTCATVHAEAPPPLGESPIQFERPIRDDDWPLLREPEFED